MISTAKTSRLQVNELELSVHLGCSPEEQESLQKIRISFEFRFASLPQACFTDEVKDTICYGSVSDSIRDFCSHSRFKTIEKLAMECFGILQKAAQTVGNDELPGFRIRVHKVHPPVECLLNGAFFEIESDASP
jgi:dihydroneopterin aldolase